MFGFIECKAGNQTATPTDFKVGNEIYVPSGMGGVFRTKVMSNDGVIATVKKPYCKDHGTQEFTVYVTPPELHDGELTLLSNIIRAKSAWNSTSPTTEELELLNRARMNGLVSRYNSWSWTEKGVERSRAYQAKKQGVSA